VSKSPMTSPTERRDRVAFLGALCMFLSTIEFLLPKPIPFLRVGIANLPILIGLEILTPGELFLVVLLKVLGQGLVGGTLVSYIFLFSAVGSFASGAAMLAVHRLLGRRVTAVGVSVAGALFSNLAQVILARLLIFGEGAWLIAPPFLAVGTVTSVLMGVFAERFSRVSLWVKGMRAGQGAGP
jgi:heptaprenyl diphosphate synthase